MPKDSISKQDMERVFRDNYSRYYFYALHFTDDAEMAKDVVSEVFLAVWKNRAGITPEKLNSYLMASIHNKSLTALKHSENITHVNEQQAMTISIAPADEWKQKEERIAHMESVVETMAPRTRYVLEQFYYHHRSYKDIAQELDITTEGVKKQLVKALTILRTDFNINKHKK